MRVDVPTTTLVSDLCAFCASLINNVLCVSRDQIGVWLMRSALL